MASVLIGERDFLARQGIRALLEPRFRVAGETEDFPSLVRAAEQSKPDIVLVDVFLPHLNAVETALRIQRVSPETKVVFLGPNGRSPWARQAIDAGCAAYIPRLHDAGGLVPVLEAVLRGGTSFPHVPEDAGALTERQSDTLRLIAEGLCSKEIASRLNLSVKTVEFHRGQLIRKLGTSNVADLTRFALQVGLVTPDA